MYEQGKTVNFDTEKFFDATKYWYHIATNARTEGSIWRRVRGKATTCDNVITQYAKTPDGKFAYRNGCYVKGVFKKSLTRTGTLTPFDPNVPSRFNMTDAASGQTSIFQVIATDYENYALVTDNESTFWIMARRPEICGNTLGKLEQKLTEIGLDTSSITVDFQVIKECSTAAAKTNAK